MQRHAYLQMGSPAGTKRPLNIPRAVGREIVVTLSAPFVGIRCDEIGRHELFGGAHVEEELLMMLGRRVHALQWILSAFPISKNMVKKTLIYSSKYKM